jgi:hypothetical protein
MDESDQDRTKRCEKKPKMVFQRDWLDEVVVVVVKNGEWKISGGKVPRG